MTKYNGNIKNLLQGVSQQPRRDRRPEQNAEQINCYSSIEDGVGKRPGGRQDLAGLVIGSFGNAAKHSYDRGDGSERYTMAVGNSGFHVVDVLTGTLRNTSSSPAGAVDYLQDFTASGTDPKDYLRLFTIADTTLLVNTTATPAMENTASRPDWQAAVHCVAANYGFTYSIRIDGVTVASYTTPSTITVTISSTTQDISKPVSLKTSDIMTQLWNGGLSAWVTANGVTASRSFDNSVIVLTKDTGTFNFEVYDANNNNDLKIVGDSHTVYEDLPAKCLPGYKVKITGHDRDEANDYYVEFIRDDGKTDVGRGHWKESVGFDVLQSFDEETMPHQIIRESNGDFTLSPNTWVDRKAGDDDSNPVPSFIGKTIKSIGTYQDRLVLISEENAIASVTYDQFNMFSESVIQSSDDDPIDTSSSDNKVTNLEHLLIFNSSLLVFSDKAQFIHPEEKAFTSKLFALSSKSRYSMDIAAPPVASATSVFFPYRFGEFIGVREYKTEALTGTVTAKAVTQHVQKYIPGRCEQIVSSTDYDILVVRSSGDAKSLHVYEWFDQDATRKQSAWHTWTFRTDIQHIDIIQDLLYVWFINDNGTVTYMELDLADRNSNGLEFPLRMDYYAEYVATDDGDNWLITKDLSLFPAGSDDSFIVVGGINSGIEGAEPYWEKAPGDIGMLINKETVPNPTGSPTFYLGVAFDGYVQITNPYVRDQLGNPKTATKTTLKTMIFNVTKTGYLAVQVDKTNAASYVHEFNSKVIGSPAYLLDSQAPLHDASIRVPIRTDADRCTITIGSNRHLPFHVSDIDWSCTYTETGRRTI